MLNLFWHILDQLWYCIKVVLCLSVSASVVLMIAFWVDEHFINPFGSIFDKRRCPSCGTMELEMYLLGVNSAHPRPIPSFYKCAHCGASFKQHIASEDYEDASGIEDAKVYAGGPLSERCPSVREELELKAEARRKSEQRRAR